MEKFPTLRLIVRYGPMAVPALTIAAIVIVTWLGWPWLGLLAIPLALFVGALVYLLARSYVELVALISEMLMPQ
jgi:hypothetical protein